MIIINGRNDYLKSIMERKNKKVYESISNQEVKKIRHRNRRIICTKNTALHILFRIKSNCARNSLLQNMQVKRGFILFNLLLLFSCPHKRKILVLFHLNKKNMVSFALKLPYILAAIALVKATHIKGVAPESKRKRLK